VLEALRQKKDVKGTETVVDAMARALSDDEHVTPLGRQLREQHRRALLLLTATPVSPPEPPVTTSPPAASAQAVVKRGLSIAEARQTFRQVEKALETDQRLRVDVECRIYKSDDLV
jgi:hypothetical protein